MKVTLIDHMGNDLTVVNAARVSFNKKSEFENVPEYYWGEKGILKESDKTLIKYLAKHEHLSPFGHCFASFHVKAPIFVARQLVKHKFLRWNEISRRYVDSKPEFYTPESWRMRADNKKQGSSDEVFTGYFYHELKDNDSKVPYRYQGGVDMTLEEVIEYYNTVAMSMYQDMIDQGIAPEQARMVLPQSTMTEWYWSGSLDAFAAMCKLRCAPDTQYESRVVANQISEIMGELYPVSWKALTDEVS